MTRLGEPACSFIPTNGWAVEGGLSTLAAHLAKDTTFLMALVAPILSKASGIVVHSALALIVDDHATGE